MHEGVILALLQGQKIKIAFHQILLFYFIRTIAQVLKSAINLTFTDAMVLNNNGHRYRLKWESDNFGTNLRHLSKKLTYGAQANAKKIV